MGYRTLLRRTGPDRPLFRPERNRGGREPRARVLYHGCPRLARTFSQERGAGDHTHDPLPRQHPVKASSAGSCSTGGAEPRDQLRRPCLRGPGPGRSGDCEADLPAPATITLFHVHVPILPDAGRRHFFRTQRAVSKTYRGITGELSGLCGNGPRCGFELQNNEGMRHGFLQEPFV